MSRKPIDLTGQVFGRLTVIEHAGSDNRCQAMWRCICECGNETIVVGIHMRRGETKSCGCYRRQCVSERRRGPKGDAAFNVVFCNYKMNAKNSKREFSLSKDEFLKLSQSNCFYCGSAPSNERTTPSLSGSFVYNGIDRVDNLRGYTVDNCVPCCISCNMAKKVMSQEEFIDLANRIAENTKRRKG